MDELVETLKAYLDPTKEWADSESTQLSVLLRFAASKILNHLYPYNATQTEVPARYQDLQIRIAAELYARMGAEGQTSHGENGITRAWASSDVAQGLLEEITPMAGTL